MVLPSAWCTKDPRPCAKIIGYLQIILAVIVLLILAAMPLIIVKFDAEVQFIHQYHHGTEHDEHYTDVPPDKNHFTLNVTLQVSYFCDTITGSINDYLSAYLDFEKVNASVHQIRNEMRKIPSYNNSHVNITVYLCEIHVWTQSDPKLHKVIEYDGQRYSIANIVALPIANITGLNKYDLESQNMTVIPPIIEKISDKVTYAGRYGNDPERMMCIGTHMRLADPEEVQDMYDLMFILLVASAAVSVMNGILYLVAGHTLSKSLLSLLFFLECISIGLMSGSAYILNHPNLCMMEYGGISSYGQQSPILLRTIITYSCAVYMGAFKGYFLWFIVCFANHLHVLVMPRKRGNIPARVVAKVAHERQKRLDLFETESVASLALSESEADIESLLGQLKKSDTPKNQQPAKKLIAKTPIESELDDDDDDDDSDEDEDYSASSMMDSEASSYRGGGGRRRKRAQKDTKGADPWKLFGSRFV